MRQISTSNNSAAMLAEILLLQAMTVVVSGLIVAVIIG